MTRHVALFVVFSICICYTLHAQTARITGTITSHEDDAGIAGATIQLEGSGRGAIARSDGSFSINEIAPGRYALSVSSIGYAGVDTAITLAAGDSLHLAFALEPDEHETDEIVVTGTRTQRSIDDVPVRVEAVPQEEVEEKILMAPSNVAMLLNESQGMRVQTTSPTTATANLRIQGLPGRYTLLLTDGLPNVAGLAAGFGLTELPPLNLRQVEIIKGAASALYGGDAIAGVVNFITKDPRADLEVSALVNSTSQGGIDIAAYAGKLIDDFGFTIMASRNTQPRFDVDDDEFADVTGVERYTVYPKLQYAVAENVHADLSLGFISDDRVGGSATAEPTENGSNSPYLEQLHSQRLSAAATIRWDVDDDQMLVVKGAGLALTREALYGSYPFDAKQTSAYAEAVYSIELEGSSFLAGAALSAERFDDILELRGFFISESRDYSYSTPGVFAQYEAEVLGGLTTLVSARADFHNVYGSFFTPRVSLMYRPTSTLTLRLGGGTGFKAPTIFIEEAEESGFSGLMLNPSAVAERAGNVTFDVNWTATLGDELGFNMNAAAYQTRVQHRLVLLPPSGSLHSPEFIGNATGDLLSRGAEITTRLNYGDFKLSLGYTYLYATQEDRGETFEVALNPRHSSGAVLMYENEDNGLKIGFETYYTGIQRLEDHPTRTQSPTYVIMGLLAEKAFGPVRVFINFENFTDTRQTRFEQIVTGDRDTLPIYAPLEGRVINGGVRLVL